MSQSAWLVDHQALHCLGWGRQVQPRSNFSCTGQGFASEHSFIPNYRRIFQNAWGKVRRDETHHRRVFSGRRFVWFTDFRNHWLRRTDWLEWSKRMHTAAVHKQQKLRCCCRLSRCCNCNVTDLLTGWLFKNKTIKTSHAKIRKYRFLNVNFRRCYFLVFFCFCLLYIFYKCVLWIFLQFFFVCIVSSVYISTVFFVLSAAVSSGKKWIVLSVHWR